MKQARITIITFFCLTFTFSQGLNTLVTDDKGNNKLLGKIDRNDLKQSYFEWFSDNYEAYVLDENILNSLNDSLNDYSIKVFLGTWCGDSKREVPRFYKVLDQMNFPKEQLEVYALDNKTETYKQSPNRDELGLNIHRVPTFIFYKDGKEINRIVESPIKTIERDMYKILNSIKYTSNYRVVSYIEDILKTNGLDYLKSMENEIIPRLAEYVKGSRELNTFGYVKLRANKIEEATYIFKLNTKLFPNNSNTFDSLGEAYLASNKYNLALASYAKVLVLKPEDENAKKMIEEIYVEKN